MTIVLYKTTSDKNVVNKTLTNQVTYTGNLREDCSVINPEFVIHSANNLSEMNYCYIESFGRYYFVQDITVGPNNIWRISCHVDVLMTYSKEFLKLDATIARQQNEWNLYLADDMYKTLVKRRYQTIKFPKSFSLDGSYIFVLAGNSIGKDESDETELSNEESLLSTEQTTTTEGDYDSQYRSGAE